MITNEQVLKVEIERLAFELTDSSSIQLLGQAYCESRMREAADSLRELLAERNDLNVLVTELGDAQKALHRQIAERNEHQAMHGVDLKVLYQQLEPHANTTCRYCDGRGVFYGNVGVCGCIMEKLEKLQNARDAVSDAANITCEQATDIAVAWAKAQRPSYYSEPFTPHAWVIDAIMYAANRSGRTVERARVPDGWKLVPSQLPDSVRDVMINLFERASNGTCMLYSDMWQDLLAAAPKPEAQS